MTADPSWLLEQEGFDPNRERSIEPLFSISNGYLGLRGSLSIPIPSSQTDLFISGIYDQKVPTIPYSELEMLDTGTRKDKYTEIVPFPSPLQLRLFAHQTELESKGADHRNFRRILDLKTGSLFEAFSWKITPSHQITLKLARTASMRNRHLLIQELEAESTGDFVHLRFLPMLLGEELSAKHPHLIQQQSIDLPHSCSIRTLETSRSEFQVAIGCKTWNANDELSSSEFEFDLDPEHPARIVRAFFIFTNRDVPKPLDTLRRTLDHLSPSRVSHELTSHRKVWMDFWRRTDIRFPKYPDLTRALRFNSFHVRAAASKSPISSIGARALSGRAYEGHIFWDTEIFMLPFLLHIDKRLAKATLNYRYCTIEGAREKAASLGYQGACYAWESTVTGRDVTPPGLLLKPANKTVPIFTGTEQIHVSADITHGIKKYWEATQDTQWMLDKGVDIVIETARFWASRATRVGNEFHLLGVVGPDEYHHDVDNNAYTNWMAKKNLLFAIECCDILSEYKKDWLQITTRLGLKEREAASWSKFVAQLYIPKPNQDGVIEQFDGYFKLRDSPFARTGILKPPVGHLIKWERSNREQLIKQADVLMIPFLFPGELPIDIVRANYDYYSPRTDHGSSLSPCVHASVAAQIGRFDEAESFWKIGLSLDLQDLMGNTSLGIHPGNMAGTWQALVFYLLGQGNPHSTSNDVTNRFLEKYGPVEQ